ncbi:flagellar basal body rod protein FlgB [Xanthomonas sp. Kuri4-1]
MANPISDYFGVHGSALPLREERMKLIASNLSNADTPGYKAKDLNFDAALQAASRQQGPLAATDSRHIAIPDNGPGPFLFTREAAQPSLDGNTVDPDLERAAYGRAALEYRASLSFLESKVKNMLTAITGQ